MNAILTPVLLVTGIGFVLAVALTVASKFFFVPVDKKAAAVREALPGANCGGCGFAGCDEYAAVLAKDPSVGTNLCTAGGAKTAKAIAQVLGLKEEAFEGKMAIVRCSGRRDADMVYNGPRTCAAAASLLGGPNACIHGCVGYGDCVRVCKYNAINVCNGISVVSRDLCVGCGKCVQACPKHLIVLVPKSTSTAVLCNSDDTSLETIRRCIVGCIGCMKCQKVCESGAVTIKNNLASVDQAKCTHCGKCITACDAGTIRFLLGEDQNPAGS